MTAVIGKPTMKSKRYDTETSCEFKTKFSIGGTDVHIKRHAVKKWEEVDLKNAKSQLEAVMLRYTIVFSLCQNVQEFATTPLFRRALNNPDDPHYRVTFSEGNISVSWDRDLDEPNQ